MDSIVKFTYIYILTKRGRKVSWDHMIDKNTSELWTVSNNPVIVRKSEIKKMYKYMVENG